LERYKRVFTLFLIVNLVGVVGYIATRYYPEAPKIAHLLFSIPIGVIFLLFCTALIYDLLRVAIELVPWSKSRREFFGKSLDVSAISLATIFIGRSLQEARDIAVESADITLRKLKKEYKIVQLSDIHIGGLIDEQFIRKIVKKVNAMKPDLVVITGDLVDIKMIYAKNAIQELSLLESTYGTFFVTGNHEFLHDTKEILALLELNRIKVLDNKSVYIGDEGLGFNLAGVHDIFGYRVGRYKPDITKALRGCDSDLPTILLAHQPLFIKEAENHDIDLMLSGHTHGGQIYPFRFLVKLQQPYIAGHYKHNDKIQVYVNRGTGYWGPPMRLGSLPEITLLNLKPKYLSIQSDKKAF
ncbi:MAG TPA: metallophosphoesterase, partial [Epsilonproteobacteria bacterium]|nr:metallophosphoesterase [Campylobacterota bacterium]